MLLEVETGEDSMICHDGGFHYAGDFMSMESDVIEPASILGVADRQELLALGFIEEQSDQPAVRVTDAGRRFVTSAIARSDL